MKRSVEMQSGERVGIVPTEKLCFCFGQQQRFKNWKMLHESKYLDYSKDKHQHGRPVWKGTHGL